MRGSVLVLAGEGGLPGTPKSFNQAFRGAGRSQDLVTHSSESQSRAPDKAKTRLLGVMLSTSSLKFPLGAQAKSSCNSRQRVGERTSDQGLKMA